MAGRRTIHLVYPSGPAVSCPEAIGRNLAARLARRYAVAQYDWDEVRLIRPRPGDVLVGHPHPLPATVFRMSSRLAGWARVIVLAPFAHGMPETDAFLDGAVSRCDLFLAITGSYWVRTVPDSVFAHWAPKLVHVDLAVDREDFPRVKGEFKAPGERRFVYIGHTHAYKNTDYLSEIAARLPSFDIAWIGKGHKRIPGLRELGQRDFGTAEGRALIAGFDFLLTVGRADANPTTILEAMSWGLIPVCTPQSGYEGQPGIVNVPLDDAGAAARILESLQSLGNEELLAMRRANDAALEAHFSWDRFAEQVVAAIESSASPRVAPLPLRRRASLKLLAQRSPFAPWRPGNVAQVARSNARRLARRLEAVRRPP